MSGSGGANFPIDIRVTGTAEAEAAFNRVSNTASNSMQRVQQSTAQAGGGMRNFGQVVGQAGFQVQDFATQVSMGQNALTAFSTQFAQFAGVFGVGGAIAGAAVTVGVLATQFLSMGESAAQAAERAKASFEGVKTETEALASVTEKINDLYLTQEERVRRVAAAAREALVSMTGMQQSSLALQLNSLTTELPGARADVARLQREAEVERQLRERATRAGGLVPQDSDVASRAFTAQTQLLGLQQEIARVDALLAEANKNAADLAANLPLPPPVPPGETDRARASVERLSEAQREYQQIMRDAEAQVSRTLSEEEKRNNILDRLSGLLAEGAISGDQYVAAVEAQRRAAEAAAEQERRRAAQETQRSAQQALQRMERENEQTTTRIVDFFGQSFARVFEGTAGGFRGLMDSFRRAAVSTFASIAAQAVIRPIVAPIVSTLGLGGLGSSSGFGGLSLGGFGGVPQVLDTGSLNGAANVAGQYASLSGAGRITGLGPAFTGGQAASGWAGLDGFLNTPISGGVGLGAPGTILPAGVSGPVMAGTEGALSIGGAIGGAASIAGGAYGIYSGIRRGGVGGTVSAIGGGLGAAAGIATLLGATLGPLGLIVPALASIAGALLPGAKPSGMGQTAFENVDDGSTGSVGLTGRRFSAGNLDASRSAVSQIADLARSVGQALGGAQFGSSVAVGTTNSRLYLDVAGRKAQFANSEEGSKELAETAGRFILQQFRENNRATGDFAGILNASGDSLETLQKNLEFYENTYKKLGEVTQATSQFGQQMAALVKPFDDAIAKAQELALSTDRLNEARQREVVKLTEQRDLRVGGLNAQLNARIFRLAGNNQAADEVLFDVAAKEEIRQTREAYEQLGLSAADVAEKIVSLEIIQGRERLDIARRYSAALISSGQDVLNWLNGQALGSLSSLSPTARLSEAERQFNAAVQSGSGITSAADALLSSSRDVLGGASAAFAEREAFVRSTVGQVGLRNARTTGSADVVNALSQMVEILSARLGSLQSSFDALSAETRRTNNLALVA